MARLARLVRQRAARAAEGVFVAEGAKLLDAALQAPVIVHEVFVAHDAVLTPAESAVVERAVSAGVDVVSLDGPRLRRSLDTVSPQAVVAVVDRPAPSPSALADATLVVVLVEVSDPGNAGTLLRTAEAAGAGAVVCTTGTVDVWSPKCVRASAGAVLHLDIIEGAEPAVALAAVRAAGYRLLGTQVTAGRSYDEVDLSVPVAVVLGNEAHGLDPRLADSVDEWVTIPMAGRAESLNVAMAGAVLCFEVLRQRRVAVAAANDWTADREERKG